MSKDKIKGIVMALAYAGVHPIYEEMMGYTEEQWDRLTENYSEASTIEEFRLWVEG